jgi:hypothetical protein
MHMQMPPTPAGIFGQDKATALDRSKEGQNFLLARQRYSARSQGRSDYCVVFFFCLDRVVVFFRASFPTKVHRTSSASGEIGKLAKVKNTLGCKTN